MAQTLLNLTNGVRGKIDLETDVTGTLGTSHYTAGSGISMADSWRLTTLQTYNAAGTYDFDDDWEQADDANFEVIGNGLLEVDGEFYFQQTGKFLVNFNLTVQRRQSTNSSYNGMSCQVSTNSGTNYDSLAEASVFTRNPDGAYNSASASCIFDVPNSSTFRMKFSTTTHNGYVRGGDSAQNVTGFTIIRLGDT